MVGRGVLLDFKAYADAKDLAYDAFDAYRITPDELEEVAKVQGVTFKQGDICIIRTGFTEQLGVASAEEQVRLLGIQKSGGLDTTEEADKCFWNKHF